MDEHIDELVDIGVIDRNRLESFYPRVRDRDDIEVLHDPESGVIVLSRCDQTGDDYYEGRQESSGYQVHTTRVQTPRLLDNTRRRDAFGHLIEGKRWLDFGCGLGGALDEMSGLSINAYGLEPNRGRRRTVTSKGHRVVGGIDELDDASLDIITLFHVMEHIPRPTSIVRALRRKLAPGGSLLIEVPHAKDALIARYKCDAFKQFTFWSEHLVLHTRESLLQLLSAAGCEDIEITGFQRYPLSNHLHWLAAGKAGGHQNWNDIDSPFLFKAYRDTLDSLDMTDTLVAFAR